MGGVLSAEGSRHVAGATVVAFYFMWINLVAFIFVAGGRNVQQVLFSVQVLKSFKLSL